MYVRGTTRRQPSLHKKRAVSTTRREPSLHKKRAVSTTRREPSVPQEESRQYTRRELSIPQEENHQTLCLHPFQCYRFGTDVGIKFAFDKYKTAVQLAKHCFMRLNGFPNSKCNPN